MRILITAYCLLCFANSLFAAVGFNNANAMVRNAASPTSNAMTVTAGGANLVAIACVAFDTTAGMSVTSVTYGGVAMTSAGAVDHNPLSPADAYAQAFYLVNPPTGSNTLAVTVAGTVNDIYVGLSSFTGVDQTTPIRAGTYTSGGGVAKTDAGGTYSLVVSSNTSDLTVSCMNGGGIAVFHTTNQTQDGFSDLGSYQASYDHATTPAASVTHTWSNAANHNFALVGFSIQASTGAAAPKVIPERIQF